MSKEREREKSITHETIGDEKEKTMKIAYALLCCVWYNFITVQQSRSIQ